MEKHYTNELSGSSSDSWNPDTKNDDHQMMWSLVQHEMTLLESNWYQ